MSDDDKQSLPAVPRQDQIEAHIIEEVLKANFDDALPLIVRHLEALEPEPSELKLFLQSFWQHLEGVRVIREEGNFDQAVELQESAAAGFQQLGPLKNPPAVVQ